MQKWFRFVWVALVLLLLVVPDVDARSRKSRGGGGGSVSVSGYYRKNGTYVRPHTRRSPGSGSYGGGYSGPSSSLGYGGSSYGSSGGMTSAAPYVPPREVRPPYTFDKRTRQWVYSGSNRRRNSPSFYPTPHIVLTRPLPQTITRTVTRRRRATNVVSVPTNFSGRVVGVSDGDTLTVLWNRTPVKVRFYGTDAPELRQAWGQQSKSFLSRLAFGKTATVYGKGRDRYGRTLGWVFVGRTGLNRESVSGGMAWWYRQYAPRESGLQTLEQQARARRVGLWSQSNPIAPWSFRR